MENIRIGNSVHVSWRLYNNNGSQYVLSGKIRRLWIISAALEKEISSYGIQGRNELVFSIPADDLIRYGTYKIRLSIRESESGTEDATYELTQVFQVVSKSYPNASGAIGGVVELPFTTVLNNVVVERIEGLSAYEIAVNNGYEGTEQEWVAEYNNALNAATTAAADASAAITAFNANEQARIEVENERVAAEQARVLAEAGRVSAESTRVSNESGRVSAEEARVSAESSRVSAESGRVSAESARVTAESSRVSQAASDHSTASSDHSTASSDHTQAVSDHGTAVSDHGTASSDHDASQSATTRANEAAAAAELMVDIHRGPQGIQGNTGSSVDYPYELVNNLTTDDATKGLSAAQGVVLGDNVNDINNLVDKGIETHFDYTIKPLSSDVTREYVRLPLVAGHSYHFKIVPGSYAPTNGSSYSFVLRSVTDSTGSTIVETIISMSRTDYTGATIEVDFTPTTSAPYLYIYIGKASTRGDGVNFTVTEKNVDYAKLQSAIGERTESFKMYPSTGGASVVFPALQMYSGRRYRIGVQLNGYTAGGGTYGCVLRAMNTPSISGASDPNIVAVILMQNSNSFGSGDIVVEYDAQADSKFLQIYAGKANAAGTGMVVTVAELTNTVKTDKSFSVFGMSADSVAVGNALGRNGSFTYFGKPLDLHVHKTDITELLTLGTSGNQGCDVASGKLFQAFASGKCRVYDFANRKPVELGNFDFACTSEDNHFNTINFGNVTPEGYDFPAIYITTGKADSPVDFVCHVEGISESGGVYSSQLIQTITLDMSDWSANGYMTIWGAPHWLVDKERGFLWVFSAKLRTTQEYTGEFKNNKYVATQFEIPALSSSEVTLTADDILKQVIFDFDTYYTQGGKIRDGKIYYCYGLGTSTYPANVRVFDTDDGSVATRMNSVLTSEPEDLFTNDEELFLVNVSGVIYQLTNK